LPGFEEQPLLVQGILASPAVLPASEKALQITVGSGRQLATLSPWSGPLGSLVKMCLGTSAWGSTVYFLTWKASVTPRNRLLFLLAPSTPNTGAIESGLWPTPAAQDGKNGTLPPSQATRDTLPGAMLRSGVTGSLNPEWVEWLMGYPTGHTALKVLGTRSFRKSQKGSRAGSHKLNALPETIEFAA
jgi:hypothetical protein